MSTCHVWLPCIEPYHVHDSVFLLAVTGIKGKHVHSISLFHKTMMTSAEWAGGNTKSVRPIIVSNCAISYWLAEHKHTPWFIQNQHTLVWSVCLRGITLQTNCWVGWSDPWGILLLFYLQYDWPVQLLTRLKHYEDLLITENGVPVLVLAKLNHIWKL